jgi:hypothetical protein
MPPETLSFSVGRAEELPSFGGDGGTPPFNTIAYAIVVNIIPATKANVRFPGFSTKGRAMRYSSIVERRDAVIKIVKTTSFVFGGDGGIPPLSVELFVSDMA